MNSDNTASIINYRNGWLRQIVQTRLLELARHTATPIQSPHLVEVKTVGTLSISTKQDIAILLSWVLTVFAIFGRPLNGKHHGHGMTNSKDV